MNSISLCMIVKNEEKYLFDCLKSVENIVDEIIVVDTGSSDKTKQIAKSFNAKIYDFVWIKDFSAARNFSLSKATSDWIFYLDADERLSPKSAQILLDFSKSKENIGVLCNVISKSDFTKTPSTMKYIRFFRNNPKISFHGRVHEQIENSLSAQNYQIIDSEIVIEHVGYNITQNGLKEKAARNLKLLEKDFAENPSSYNAFQLGQTLIFLDEFEKSQDYFEKVLAKSDLDKFHLAQTCRYIGAWELRKKNYVRAKELAEKGLKFVPTSPLLHILYSNICAETNRISESAIHTKLAFEHNSNLLSGKTTSRFEVMADEQNLVLYGINVSLMAIDKELFNYFYQKIHMNVISKEELLLIDFYKFLFFSINEKFESSQFLPISNKIDEKIALPILEKFQNNANKIEILTFLDTEERNSSSIKYLLGVLLINTNYEKAVELLEKVSQQNPENSNLLIQLMGLYLEKNDFIRLSGILEKIIKIFPGESNIAKKATEILSNIKK